MYLLVFSSRSLLNGWDYRHVARRLTLMPRRAAGHNKKASFIRPRDNGESASTGSALFCRTGSINILSSGWTFYVEHYELEFKIS